VVFQLHLHTETVGHIDTSQPLCLDPEMSARQVLEIMRTQRRGSVCLCRDEKLVGIFTERDALYLMAEDGDMDVPIKNVMSREPATISASDTVEAAIAKMSLGGYRRLPVLDDHGRPVGLLKVSAILHYLVQHFPQYVYNLPPQPDAAVDHPEGA
jgi:CBS domain-containing protein